MSRAIHPVLPPELQWSIIDFIADEKDAPTRRFALARCARVTKCWHRHAIKRLWEEIYLHITEEKLEHKRVLGILSQILLNPELTTHIRHLWLTMEYANESHTAIRPLYANHPDLFALFNFLPPVAKLSLTTYEMLRTDVPPTDDSAFADTSPMGYALAPFLRSNILTTLRFDGDRFHLNLLAAAPNLSSLELVDVAMCYHSATDIPSEPLPFRLKVARFYNSWDVVTLLVQTNVQMFSQLENLDIRGEQEMSESEIRQTMVQLFHSAKSTMKDLATHIRGQDFMEFALRQGLTTEWIYNLRTLSIEVEEWEKDNAWTSAVALDMLERKSVPFKHLETIKISISYLELHKLKTFFDPENRGWQLAQRLLSPEVAPKLQEVSFSVSWADFREEEGRASSYVCQGLKTTFSKAFDRCLPEWEADERKLRRTFDFGPRIGSSFWRFHGS